MVHIALSCLNQLASYLKVDPGKININANNMVSRTKDKRVHSGFINIVVDLIEESNIKSIITNHLEEVQLWQWLEYCISYAVYLNSHQNIHQTLSEFNEVLELKTYLVGHKLTIADVVLYYILYNVMLNLTPTEKEIYLNVSRWFNNIQQDSSVRQSNKLVNFSSNYVIHMVPSRYM